MLVVIDTNVLVSAFWSRNGNCAQISALMVNRKIIPCYDYRIMEEYIQVLSRPKFGFEQWEIDAFLSQLRHDGISVLAKTIDMPFVDESDRKFYEVARHCDARLITGNSGHFPDDGLAIPPVAFLAGYKF